MALFAIQGAARRVQGRFSETTEPGSFNRVCIATGGIATPKSPSNPEPQMLLSEQVKYPVKGLLVLSFEYLRAGQRRKLKCL
jgi:hypothetical protein